MPEISRDDYNPYRETLLQYHLYGFIFKEAEVEPKIADNNFFEDQLDVLTKLSVDLIDQCRISKFDQMIFSLRWYSSGKVKSMINKSSFTSENELTKKYKSDPSPFDLKLIKQVSEIKEKLSPTLVRLTFAILETLKYYCKVSKKCIKDRPISEMADEYCKRVIFTIKISGTLIVQQ